MLQNEHYYTRVKPIFLCEAKPFTLGTSVGLDPERQNFALPIPTCWYLKSKNICVTPNAKHKICVTPNANPQRKSVEYRLRWVPNAKFLRWPCTFHFFGGDFIRVGFRFLHPRRKLYQTQKLFSVEYGLIKFSFLSTIVLVLTYINLVCCQCKVSCFWGQLVSLALIQHYSSVIRVIGYPLCQVK